MQQAFPFLSKHTARSGEISSVAMGIKPIAASLNRMSGGFSVWAPAGIKLRLQII
jgi:hypothetical protein